MSVEESKAKPKNKGNKGLRTGSIFKRVEKNARGKVTRTFYVVRRRYTDSEGRRREKKRRVDTYNDALDADRQIKELIKAELAAPKKPEPERTFKDLADYYEREYVVEARYVDEEKVAGFREPLSHIRRQLRLLREHFGALPLSQITYDHARRFRDLRLATPVVVKKKVVVREEGRRKIRELREFARPRGMSSVNHDLKRLRRVLNIGVRLGWLVANPMTAGDPLINIAAERERTRILTEKEEAALLAVCVPPRAHLLLPVFMAIETAGRRGELYRLRWRDVDLENGVLTLTSYKGKLRRERLVPITAELRAALEEKYREDTPGEDARVITITHLRRSFKTALRLAGIDDFTFRDLRHVGTTHMVETGLPDARVMRMTGHTQHKTFLRYVNDNLETVQAAATLLDERRERKRRERDEEPTN
jgi:integrase